MEEKLITFETAKLAKEKGFDWILLNYYHTYPSLDVPFVEINEVEILIKNYKNPYNPYRNYNIKKAENGVENYSAPTQSLLQKWLREVHNIHVCAITFDNSKGKYTISVIFNNEEYYNNRESQIWFETYEDALESGLQESLKLIPIK